MTIDDFNSAHNHFQQIANVSASNVEVSAGGSAFGGAYKLLSPTLIAITKEGHPPTYVSMTKIDWIRFYL